MRPEQIIRPLRDDLEEFAADWGHVSLAADPFNVYERLTQGPHGALIVLHWAGDQQEASDYRVPIVRGEIEVYVGRNKGLRLEPGSQLVEDDHDGEQPLFRIVSDVRDRVRLFDFEAAADVAPQQTDKHAHYRGTAPVPMPDGLPLAAYRITFGLYHSLPAVGQSFAG